MSQSFMDRLRAQMNSAVGQTYAGEVKPYLPKLEERHRHPVDTNRWDRKMYGRMRQTSSINGLIEDLAEGDDFKGGDRAEFDPAPELVEGLWQTFWKAVPRLTPKRQLERDLYPVTRILEEMLANPKHQELQGLTANDETFSTMAVDSMGDVLREILTRVGNAQRPETPEEQREREEQEQAEQGSGQPGEGGEPDPNAPAGEGPGQDGQQPGQGDSQPGDQGDQPAEGAPSETPGQGQGDQGDNLDETDLTEGAETDEFDPNSEEALEQAETDWEQAFDDVLGGLDLDRLVDEALGDALEEVHEVESLRKGIGLEDGEWSLMDPTERFKWAAKFRTPEMKVLAQMIGRMKRYAMGVKATRINDVPHMPFDVEQGNDLRRVLRAQFALLGHPGAKYEFYRRYANKELLQFKLRGTEEVGKGPIVICIDKSGSMKGGPMNWAIAVAESLRRFAQEEARDYYAMYFGNNNQRVRFDFPLGAGPFEKVMTFMSPTANGGTQFDGVLTEALEKASTSFDGEGRGKADIVFVTDGAANLSEEWITQFNDERKRVGVRLYSVYIGGATDMENKTGPLALLQNISDITIPVKELNPQAVRQVFLQV